METPTLVHEVVRLSSSQSTPLVIPAFPNTDCHGANVGRAAVVKNHGARADKSYNRPPAVSAQQLVRPARTSVPLRSNRALQPLPEDRPSRESGPRQHQTSAFNDMVYAQLSYLLELRRIHISGDHAQRRQHTNSLHCHVAEPNAITSAAQAADSREAPGPSRDKA